MKRVQLNVRVPAEMFDHLKALVARANKFSMNLRGPNTMQSEVERLLRGALAGHAKPGEGDAAQAAAPSEFTPARSKSPPAKRDSFADDFKAVTGKKIEDVARGRGAITKSATDLVEQLNRKTAELDARYAQLDALSEALLDKESGLKYSSASFRWTRFPEFWEVEVWGTCAKAARNQAAANLRAGDYTVEVRDADQAGRFRAGYFLAVLGRTSTPAPTEVAVIARAEKPAARVASKKPAKEQRAADRRARIIAKAERELADPDKRDAGILEIAAKAERGWRELYDKLASTKAGTGINVQVWDDRTKSVVRRYARFLRVVEQRAAQRDAGDDLKVYVRVEKTKEVRLASYPYREFQPTGKFAAPTKLPVKQVLEVGPFGKRVSGSAPAMEAVA